MSPGARRLPVMDEDHTETEWDSSGADDGAAPPDCHYAPLLTAEAAPVTGAEQRRSFVFFYVRWSPRISPQVLIRPVSYSDMLLHRRHTSFFCSCVNHSCPPDQSWGFSVVSGPNCVNTEGREEKRFVPRGSVHRSNCEKVFSELSVRPRVNIHRSVSVSPLSPPPFPEGSTIARSCSYHGNTNQRGARCVCVMFTHSIYETEQVHQMF